MSRIRGVKPDFFKHEDLALLSPLHRLAFIGLWTQADREGRLEDRPRKLKTDVLPYDPCDFSAILNDLVRAGFIRRYVVQGQSYLLVPKLKKHQRFHPDEKQSVLPPPPETPESTNVISEEHQGDLLSARSYVERIPEPEQKQREETERERETRTEKGSGVLAHRRAKRAPDPRVHPVIDHFCKRYRETTGQSYSVTAADGEAVRRLPKDKSAEYLGALLERFFAEADAFDRHKAGFTLRYFCQRVPALETRGAQPMPDDPKLSATVVSLQAFVAAGGQR